MIKKTVAFIFFIFYPALLYSAFFNIIDTGDSEKLNKSHKHYKTRYRRKKTKTYHKKKIIYLTFDDGPLLGTNNIISVIKNKRVKATMFMIGKHLSATRYRKRSFLRAIKEPLILVANHSYSHADGRYKNFYSNPQKVLNDINSMDKILMKYDKNYSYPYCRLPGRNVWRLTNISKNDPGIPTRYHEVNSYETLKESGYQIFGWDYQWEYNPKNGKVYKTPQKVVQAIEKIYKRGRTRMKGKFILLMHDFCFRDRFNGKEILSELIDRLKDLGWKFETVKTYTSSST